MNNILFYNNHHLYNEYGSLADGKDEIIIDIESNAAECEEVIVMHEGAQRDLVIDLSPNNLEEKDDVVIVIDQQGELYQEELSDRDYVVIDIYDELNHAVKSIETGSPEELLKTFSNLKIHDSTLKILSNMFKNLDMRQGVELTKKIRNFVKFIQSCKTVRDGKVVYDVKAIGSLEKRREVIGSYFTSFSLAAGTFSWIAEGLKSGIFTKYLGNYGEACTRIASFTGVSTKGLKFLYKLSSFESAVRQPVQESMQTKNILILRSGIEAAREVTKMGLLLTGYSNPMITTTLAVSGVVSGAAGLYLTFNAPHSKKT